MYNKFAKTLAFLFIYNLGLSQKIRPSEEQFEKLVRQTKDYLNDFTKTTKSLTSYSSTCDETCRQYKIEVTINHFLPDARVLIYNQSNKRKSYSILQYLNRLKRAEMPRQISILNYSYTAFNSSKMEEMKNEKGQTYYNKREPLYVCSRA